MSLFEKSRPTARGKPRQISSTRISRRGRYARGRLASALSWASASSPASSFGKAAAAIIAALSVESWRLGKKTPRPRELASSSKLRRSWRFAATPPETRTERAPDQILRHRLLEAGNQIERARAAERAELIRSALAAGECRLPCFDFRL